MTRDNERYPLEVQTLIEELVAIQNNNNLGAERQAMATQLLRIWDKYRPNSNGMTLEEIEEYFRAKGKSKTQYVAVLKRAIPVESCSVDTVTAALDGDCTLDQLERWVEKHTTGNAIKVSLEICKAEVINE